MTGKPTPTALHKLRGTFNPTRHGRDRAGEPVAKGVLDTAPAWMSPSQKEGWNYALENAPLGVLTKIDRTILAIWVEAEDRHRTATIMQQELDKNNPLKLLTKSKDGEAIESPYSKILNKVSLVLIRAASEIGFTPASRPRLKITAGDNAIDDPWARLKVIHGGKA